MPEYVFRQQVARPTGGYWRTGEIIALTAHEHAMLEPALRACLVDPAAAAAKMAAARSATDEARERDRMAALAKLRTRKRKKSLRAYADKMMRASEDK